MQSTNNSNLLEIIDLAHSLREEHLFIANEQDTFNQLNDDLCKNALNIVKVSPHTHTQKRTFIHIELNIRGINVNNENNSTCSYHGFAHSIDKI